MLSCNMKLRKIGIMFLIFSLVFTGVGVSLGTPVSYAASSEVYVSNGGDDTNDGSREHPFATLQKAYQEVSDGGKIYLLDDITLTDGVDVIVAINEAKQVTITTAPDVNKTAMIKRGKPSGKVLFQLTNKSQITLRNIIIDGNSEGMGGAIDGRLFNVYSGSTLTIDEGAILQNSYSLHQGSAIYTNNTGSIVEMKGGEIRGNQRASIGAAIFVDPGAQFIMTGGHITNNIGGGVESRGGEIVLSGEANITGNTFNGKAVNVNLVNYKTLILNGAFTGEAGITTQSMTPGTQFGRVTEEGLGSVENLIADSGSLLASYDENNTLEWRLFKNELSQPSTDGEITGARPILKGVTEPNAAVTINIFSAEDQSLVITKEVTADENGNWEFTVDKDLSADTYTVKVTASKGGINSQTQTRGLVVLKNPPAAEAGSFIEGSNTITIDFDKAVTLALGDGEAANDGFKVTVNGTDVAVESVTTDPNDPSKVILTLPEGTKLSNVDTVHVDYDGELGHLIGNEEYGSAVSDFNLDAKDPFTAALQITGPSSDTVSVRQPEIHGSVEPGSVVTVVIKDANGNEVPNAGGTATVDDSGNWSFTPGADLGDGSYTIEAIAVKDSKTARKTKELNVDATKPALTINEPSGSTVIDSKPEFKGVTDPGSSVTAVIKDKNGNIIGIPEVTVNSDGTWSFVPVEDLPDGEYVVEVSAEKDNKTSTVTKELVVDTAKPELTITEPSTEQVNAAKPEFKGTADQDARITVELKDANGNVIEAREVEIDSNGNWSFAPLADLPDGTYTVDVTAVKDGKESKSSKTIVVDTAVDESPQLSSLEVKSSDGTPIGLSPAFNGNTYNYTATTATYSVYLAPTLDSISALDPNAKIEVSLNNGSWMDMTNGTASDDLPLNEGRNTIVVKVTANGRETLYTLTVFRSSNSGGGHGDNDNDKGSSGGGGGGSTTTPTTSDTSDAPKSNLDVTLNGTDNPFATGTVSTSNGRTTTAVKVDQGKLADAISQGNNQKLAIHSPSEGDLTVDGLTADTLRQLGDKGANLEISNLLAIYPVPAGKMNLSSVASQLGNAALSDIGVRIDIKRASENVIASAKSKAAAAGYELLVDPVDLDLTFSHDGQTAKSGQLNGYAVKYIALPEGVDPNRITTGVIINPDGSVYHVPTVVTEINNRYFAQINDLRSSGTYSVIWNPQDFEDVRNHWGKEDVNNIAARLDLKGNGNNTFAPNRSITRSEFAEIVVLGLGLMRSDAPQSSFADVSGSAWYAKSVAIANEFDIVRGYEDGKFYGDKQITREQGFSMIARAYRLIQSVDAAGQDTSALSRYTDGAKVSNWAKADVAQLIEAGIIEGNGTKLSPQATMTRAEVTALIARMLKATNLIDK